jgi:protein-tyrosine phosphatase
VCRSIFAEAIFSHLIQDQDLQDSIECTSKASKDYNVGEAPDARAVEVAQELGLQLREGAVARVFDCTSDIVLFDLLLVMDKFNASDVLKEVTVYEAIDKEGRYSYKVRRLGEFCRKRTVPIGSPY